MHKGERGVTLVEVLVAMGIIAIGVALFVNGMDGTNQARRIQDMRINADREVESLTTLLNSEMRGYTSFALSQGAGGSFRTLTLQVRRKSGAVLPTIYTTACEARPGGAGGLDLAVPARGGCLPNALCAANQRAFVTVTRTMAAGQPPTVMRFPRLDPAAAPGGATAEAVRSFDALGVKACFSTSSGATSGTRTAVAVGTTLRAQLFSFVPPTAWSPGDAQPAEAKQRLVTSPLREALGIEVRKR